MAFPTLPAFTMAFQPIVDADQRAVFAYEALVRGLEGEGALEVLGQVGPEQRFAFHEACRMRAIELAAGLGMRAKLSLNVMPNDVAGQEQCFRSAMAAAARFGFPVEQLMFELTEGERVRNLPGLAASFKTFKRYGFTSAIDDFGAAYAGFELLAGFQPDIVKVDMSLVRGVDADPVRLAIVRGFVQTCGELRARVVAEGIETREELRALRGIGVKLFQGYLFSRPVIATLPPIAWDAAS
ncbi:EAL domain-containing protein [Variovorax ginsengisoli]|uniref:EAL domain-containing protein n=1 Tax=Variovorax ginsengisoli TaxID=363844 RepID=A0ABT8SF40_9BURK|nr:EAL domain-containing protein [Variovorax ginsengisoli]MDN8618364.1 EAL domain-containing protein [Variovorax ginsengisoli]MDO1537534.1 EAL domain-containing protein [Variovorax ginsengisoli]